LTYSASQPANQPVRRIAVGIRIAKHLNNSKLVLTTRNNKSSQWQAYIIREIAKPFKSQPGFLIPETNT
jgi:hypothetical protein